MAKPYASKYRKILVRIHQAFLRTVFVLFYSFFFFSFFLYLGAFESNMTSDWLNYTLKPFSSFVTLKLKKKKEKKKILERKTKNVHKNG